MIIALTLLAVVLAVAGIFLSDAPDGHDKPTFLSLGIAAGVGLVAFLIARALPVDPSNTFAPDGLMWGALGALLLGALGLWKAPAPAVAIGLAAAVAYPVANLGSAAVYGLVVGAALVGLALGSPSVGTFALAAAAGGAVQFFAKVSDVPPGLELGTALAAASFLSLLLKKQPALAAPVAAVIGAGALYVTGAHSPAQFLAAPLAGLAVTWLIGSDDKRSTTASMTVALIWLGLATLSFATDKSAGMAIALLVGVGIPLAVGNVRAAGTVAPLAALVWYRLVHQSDPDLARGSDLSQFYIVIGAVIGAGFCGLVWEWRARVEGAKGVAGGGVWGLLTAGVTVLAQMVFGVKGLSGLLAGSGLGSLVGSGEKRPLTPVMVTAMLGGVAAILVKWTSKVGPEDRDGKIKLFVSAAAAILLVGAFLFALQRQVETEVKA